MTLIRRNLRRPMSVTPEQFAEFLKAEIVRWGKVIKDANLSID